MALGRISGPLLKANLLRDGVDLAFETDLLYLSVEDATQPLKVVGVGINTDNPTADLHVNGTTRTIFLDTDNLNIGDIEISGDTIRNTQPSGIINLKGPVGQDSVFYQTALTVDNITIDNNVISTNASNVDLELRPSGTGSVEIFADTNVYGNITVTGDITAEGNINVGNADTDSITFNADVSSNIIPDQNLQYSLGSTDKRWLNLYSKEFYIDNLEVDEVDLGGINLALRQGNIYYVAVNGNDTYSGTHQNDPFATVAKALSVATAGDTVYIYPGVYDELLPLTVPAGVTVKGSGIRSVKIVPDTASTHENVFLLNGETTIEDLTIADYFYDAINDTGYGFSFAPGYKVTTRSPYIRNVTVLTKGSITDPVNDPLGFDQGDAGRGAKLDGSLADATSKESSCLFHSVTMITPGVDALTMTNGVRVEWLNSFTYFANRGLYAYKGATGLKGDGKTRVKITNTTGTWAVGNTITYYDVDGTTVLAQGVVESIDGDYYVIDGYSAGWETLSDRSGKTVTVSGNAQLDTAQKKFGTASLLLDGTGDFITYASQPDFAFGTGDFTIEFFWRPAALGTQQVLLDCRTASNDTAVYLEMNAAGNVRLFVSNAYRITSSVACTAGSFNHIALFRVAGVTKLAVNGTITPTTWSDATNYPARPLRLGATWVGTVPSNGHFDELRVVKGLAKYTTSVTVPTVPFTNDSATVLLLHFNGLDGSTAIVDDGNTTQDIRSSAGGTATVIDFVNYTDFGAEIRSIASANVYGNYGAYGDGDGVIAYLIGQNFGYIGSGKSSDNDATEVIQANEVVELNRAKIYYSSVDHKGDFRIGDLFYVNQQTGEVTFSNSDINIGTSLTFDDGLGNVTFIDATKIETGNFRISGNTIETLSGDFNVLSASDQINLQNNVNIAGNLDVTGNVTVGGDINLGDQSTDTISFVAGVASDIIPNTNITYDLGTNSLQWRTLYTGTLEVGEMTFSTNVITTNTSNSDLVLAASGTGSIVVPTNDVELNQNLTVNGTTNLDDTNITGQLIHVGNLTHTGDLTQTGVIDLTGNLTVSGFAQFDNIRIDGNVVSTTDLNSDLQLEAAGTGRIYVPNNDVVIDQDLTVNGVTNLNSLNVTNTVTANAFTTGNILIDDNFITTTNSNSDLELLASGTGRIYIPNNDVEITNDLTVDGLTTLANTTINGTVTHVGDLDQTGDTVQTGNYTLTGDLTVSNAVQFEDVNIDGNVITTTIGNNDLILGAAGTGRVVIPDSDLEITQDLTVNGTIFVNDLNVDTTVVADSFSTGNILIDDNFITTTISNSDLELRAAGTGDVTVTSNDVRFGQTLTVSGLTTLANTTINGTITHVGNTTRTGDVNQTGSYSLTGNLTVGADAQFKDIKIFDNVITTTIGNNDLELAAAGTGRVTVPLDNVLLSQNLTVVGTTSTTTINNSGTITSGTFSTGDISVNANTITTTVGNNNLVLGAAGTGVVSVPSNNVTITNNLTVNGTTSLAGTNITGTITHVGALNQTGATLQNGNYTLNGQMTVNNVAQFEDIKIDGNVITTTIGNNDLQLEAAGTGRIYVPSDPVRIDQTLTVVGTTSTSNINNTGTVTSATFTTGNINITGNTISTTISNSNLQLQAAGTGFIELEQFQVQENELRTASNTDIIMQPHGTGIVSVSSTQSIRLPRGTTAERPAIPTTGMIRFNTGGWYEGYNGTNWIRLDGVWDVDQNTYITAELTPGANDNTIRFVSNGTQIADLTASRLSIINADIDSINLNNNVISTNTSNTDLVFQTQGSGAVRLGNFAINGNTITNTVNNAITSFVQAGDGYFRIAGTNGFRIPSGTNAQRPGQLEIGLTRFNTDDGRLEIYDGTQWIGAQGTGGSITVSEAQDISILTALMLG